MTSFVCYPFHVCSSRKEIQNPLHPRISWGRKLKFVSNKLKITGPLKRLDRSGGDSKDEEEGICKSFPCKPISHIRIVTSLGTSDSW
jgi:hypothetical protein